MLRHEDLGVNAPVVTTVGCFQNFFDHWIWGEKQGGAITTRGDEVEGFNLLVSLDTAEHGVCLARGGSFRDCGSQCSIHRGLFAMNGVRRQIYKAGHGCLGWSRVSHRPHLSLSNFV